MSYGLMTDFTFNSFKSLYHGTKLRNKSFLIIEIIRISIFGAKSNIDEKVHGPNKIPDVSL